MTDSLNVLWSDAQVEAIECRYDEVRWLSRVAGCGRPAGPVARGSAASCAELCPAALPWGRLMCGLACLDERTAGRLMPQVSRASAHGQRSRRRWSEAMPATANSA